MKLGVWELSVSAQSFRVSACSVDGFGLLRVSRFWDVMIMGIRGSRLSGLQDFGALLYVSWSTQGLLWLWSNHALATVFRPKPEIRILTSSLCSFLWALGFASHSVGKHTAGSVMMCP